MDFYMPTPLNEECHCMHVYAVNPPYTKYFTYFLSCIQFKTSKSISSSYFICFGKHIISNCLPLKRKF